MIPDPAGGTGLEEDVAQDDRGVQGKMGSLAPRHHHDSRHGRALSRWHTRDAKRFPHRQRLFERDLAQLIREWIVPGYAPEAGMLSAQDNVITLGSCFARQLRDCLTDLGCSSGGFRTPSRLVSTFAILDFISWCVTGEEIGRGYRYVRMDDGEIREWTPEAGREEYLQGIREAGAFVFGFGVSEVWQDRETGAVFWRGVPKDVYKAGRHEFRLTTVEENEENLLRIVELIRSVNATAPIVLMLSPIPVPATFRDIGCIPADCVSKSVLRVAFDRVVSRGVQGVYYWPSFEVVRWAGAHLPWRAYGTNDGKPTNITHYLVAETIEAFVDAFYTPEAVAELRAKGSGRTVPSPRSLRGRIEYPLLRLAKRKKKRARRLFRPARSER